MTTEEQLVKNIKKLISLCECSYNSHDYAENSFIINSYDIKLHKKTVSDIKKQFSKVGDTVSENNISEALVDFVCKATQESAIVDYRRIKEALNEPFRTKRITEQEVFHGVQGLLVSEETPVEVGEFTFYDFHKHKSFLEQRISGDLHGLSKHETLVSVTVKTRDKYKARDIAREKFCELQNLFRFCCSFLTDEYDNWYDVGILNYRVREIDEYDIFTKGGNYDYTAVGTGATIREYYSTISDKMNNNERISVQELIEMICRKKKTEMQERLMRAIHFFGMAVYDIIAPISFVESVMAIEALLSEKHTPITAKIAEYCAFILGTSYEKRVEISKKMKGLYRNRSDIVHGKLKEIDYYERIEALRYARDLIASFIRDENLRRIKSIEELSMYIEKLKYAVPDIP
jgi:hypothetical protein